MNLQEFLNIFLGGLQDSGIRYCILRNHEGLPQVNIGSDIDILIEPGQQQSALDLLRRIDQISIVFICSRAYVQHIFIYGIEGLPSNSLQLDFISSFEWKGFRYLDAERVLESAGPGRDPIIRIPEPSHEAIISFFSSYLLGGWIKPRYQAFVGSTFSSNRGQVVRLLSESLGVASAEKLVDSVIQKDDETSLGLRPAIIRNLVLRGLCKHPTSSIAGLLKHVYREARIRYTRYCIIDIVFLGIDGSGKSTLINGVSDCIKGLAKDHSTTHLKPSVLRQGKKNDSVVSDPHAKPPRHALASTIKLFSWVIAYHANNVFHGHKAPTIRLWDRHYFDVKIDPVRYRIDLPTWLFQLFDFVTPGIDKIIVIDVSPDTVIGRKDEIPHDVLPELTRRYMTFTQPDTAVSHIDGNRDPDDVCKQAFREILDLLSNPHKQKSIKNIHK